MITGILHTKSGTFSRYWEINDVDEARLRSGKIPLKDRLVFVRSRTGLGIVGSEELLRDMGISYSLK